MEEVIAGAASSRIKFIFSEEEILKMSSMICGSLILRAKVGLSHIESLKISLGQMYECLYKEKKRNHIGLASAVK